MDLLVIEHKDGRTYAVSAANYRKHYEADGFKAVRYESGKEYEPPAAKSETTDKPAKTEKPT